MATTMEAPEKPGLRLSTDTMLLNAADRCDQCGAQAFVRIEFMAEQGKRKELYLCGHHYHRGEEKIRRTAVSIQDETWRINEKPTS